MLPVNRVVKVKILTAPIFPRRRGFGIPLILGTTAVLPVGERSRSFANMDEVATLYSSDSQEYLAAQVAFSQNPRPDSIRIGRRFPSPVAGELLGRTLQTTSIETWAAIEDASFRVSIDGSQFDVTGVDFAGVTNLNGVASALQTALQAKGGAAATALVMFDGTRFIIRSGTLGPSSSVSRTSPVDPATGTHIGGLMDTDDGTATSGRSGETITEALDAQADFSTEWYGVHFTNGQLNTDDDVLEASAWTEARVKIFAHTSADERLLDPLVTDDFASRAKAMLFRRSFFAYDRNDSYLALSAMSRAFAVNFNNQNSTITLKFKTMPGVEADDTITTNQANTLDSKNVNYYVPFGESPMFAEGKMASGVFFDEVHGLDWLQNAIETNVFGFLYTRTTKVPQTDKGVALTVSEVEKACQEGVNNGLLAPGNWNGSEFGTLKVGDFLKRGFYVYAQPVAEQNQSDREARKAPPIQVAAKGAGAIHFVDIEVTFDR